MVFIQYWGIVISYLLIKFWEVIQRHIKFAKYNQEKGNVIKQINEEVKDFNMFQKRRKILLKEKSFKTLF